MLIFRPRRYRFGMFNYYGVPNPIKEILQTISESKKFSHTIADRWKRMGKGLTFVIIGNRSTGKTSILRVMRGKVVNPSEVPTPPGGQRIKDFVATLVDDDDNYDIETALLNEYVQ